MIDTARHFLEISDIKRTINGMRTIKLNILHIHFVDSESFPVYIETLPNITKYGAYNEK